MHHDTNKAEHMNFTASNETSWSHDSDQYFRLHRYHLFLINTT